MSRQLVPGSTGWTVHDPDDPNVETAWQAGHFQIIEGVACEMFCGLTIELSGLELDRDIDIRFTGLRPGEKLYEELFSENERYEPTHHPKIMVAATASTVTAGFLNDALKTVEEKTQIATIARTVAGALNVDDQLEVAVVR